MIFILIIDYLNTNIVTLDLVLSILIKYVTIISYLCKCDLYSKYSIYRFTIF